jgi:hypothetical protein
MNEEILANKKFPAKITSKERAIFEIGIKLGALYHIAMGMPISKDSTTIASIETALANSIKSQPYVTDVSVKIDSEKVRGTKSHQFDYSEINATNIECTIHLKYKDYEIIGVLEWNNELRYPLMYFKSSE